MKNTITTSLLLFFFLFQNQNVTAQWNFSEGMDEANCPSLVSLDSTLFACTRGNGIYSRDINGGQWNHKLPSQDADKVLKAGNVLFAHETFYNYRSMDHGETWDTLSFFLDFSLLLKLCFSTPALLRKKTPSFSPT